MELGLVLSVLKLSLEIFKDERKDRFLKKFLKLEKEWMDEISKPDNEQSDLMLDRLHFDAESLAKLVIAEASRK
jgi:hypothetical protein